MSRNTPNFEDDVSFPIFATGIIGGIGTVIAGGITAIFGGPIVLVATGAAVVFGLLGGVGITGLDSGTSGRGNLSTRQTVGFMATAALAASTWGLGNAVLPADKAAAKEEFNYVCKGSAQQPTHGDNTIIAMKKSDCKKVKI